MSRLVSSVSAKAGIRAKREKENRLNAQLSKTIKDKNSQQDFKTQLLQNAANATNFLKDQGYDFLDEVLPATRSEALPPAIPSKDRFNPDQIVDIVRHGRSTSLNQSLSSVNIRIY